MKNGIRILTMLGAIFVAFSQAPSAYAQATRTWVSGVGDDANPCSRTAPCKTWPGAISKTAAGGEIDALDPGGFGAVTITKSITLDGGGGQVASVLVSGTNGIVVSAGAADTITLRNLRINGIGSGINGVQYLAGAALIVISVNGQCPPINEAGVTCATKFSQHLADFGLTVASFALDTGLPLVLAVGGLIFLMRDVRRKTNQAPS